MESFRPIEGEKWKKQKRVPFSPSDKLEDFRSYDRDRASEDEGAPIHPKHHITGDFVPAEERVGLAPSPEDILIAREEANGSYETEPEPESDTTIETDEPEGTDYINQMYGPQIAAMEDKSVTAKEASMPTQFVVHEPRDPVTIKETTKENRQVNWRGNEPKDKHEKGGPTIRGAISRFFRR